MGFLLRHPITSRLGGFKEERDPSGGAIEFSNESISELEHSF